MRCYLVWLGAAMLLGVGCSSGGYAAEDDMVQAVDAQLGLRDLATASADLASADLAPADSCGCHAGQHCVAGRCEFTCTGLRVPGDFATLAEALNKVASVGGTICLGEGTHLVSGQLKIEPQKSLQIIGVSALRTTVQMATPADDIYFSGTTGPAANLLLAGFRLTGGIVGHLPADGANYTFDSLHLEQLVILYQNAGGFSTLRIGQCTLDDGIYLQNAHAEIVASKLHGVTNDAIFASHQADTMEVLVDGCEFQTKSDAVTVYENSPTAMLPSGSGRVSLQNNYLTGGSNGVVVLDNLLASDLRTRTFEVNLINNTIASSTGSGIYTIFKSKYVTWNLTYVNNVIYGNQTGVDLQIRAADKLVHRNNALFGNKTDYSGLALAGAGYVTADPLLDQLKTPWAPLSSSPLRGAADPTLAPSRDFFGLPRTPKPDIGCVQYAPPPPALR